MIEAMADGLSRAMEKEKLLNAFARRSRELDTLRQIGSALAASTFDMDKVLQHTMDMIQVIMDVEAGSLMFLDGNELEFKVAFNIGVNVDGLKGSRFQLGEGDRGLFRSKGRARHRQKYKRIQTFQSGVSTI